MWWCVSGGGGGGVDRRSLLALPPYLVVPHNGAIGEMNAVEAALVDFDAGARGYVVEAVARVGPARRGAEARAAVRRWVGAAEKGREKQ